MQNNNLTSDRFQQEAREISAQLAQQVAEVQTLFDHLLAEISGHESRPGFSG